MYKVQSERIKELMKDMKKTLKVMACGLWVMGVLLLSMPAMAQTMQFQSTSAMRGTGSVYTPQVTAVGATTAPSQATTTTESYSPAKAPGMRKFDLGGDTEAGPSPIGDAVVPMIAFALVFCGVIALRRKRAA